MAVVLPMANNNFLHNQLSLPQFKPDEESFTLFAEGFKLQAKELGNLHWGLILDDDERQAKLNSLQWYILPDREERAEEDQQALWSLIFSAFRNVSKLQSTVELFCGDKDKLKGTRAWRAIEKILNPTTRSSIKTKLNDLETTIKSFNGEWTQFLAKVQCIVHWLRSHSDRAPSDPELAEQIIDAVKNWVFALDHNFDSEQAQTRKGEC